MDTGVQRAGSGNPENLPAAVSLLYKTALELISTKAALSEVLSCLCKLMEQQFPGLVCSVLILDSDGVTLRHGAAPSLPDEYIRAIDGARIGPAVGSCGTSAYRKEPVVVTSVATDPLWRNYRHLALPHALQACWSTPIFSRAGAVLGTFAVYYREPRGPENDHLQFVQSATHLAGIAIEREQAEAELQAVETRYRALVEHIPAITYIADFGVCGSWHFVSPQIQSILGFTPEEWLANSSNWVNQLHPEDRDRALAAESRFSERGGLFRSEYRMSARDGRTLWFRDEARLLHAVDRNAKPRMQGVMYDITEYKQLEEQLRQSQKMEAVGKLAGGVAHDFNNMLTAIIGFGGLLQMKLDKESHSQGYLDQILSAAEKAANLSQGLLTFSRKQVLDTKPVDLTAIVTNMNKILSRVIGDDIEFKTVLNGENLVTMADGSQIEQVLLNLATNARDAMPKGGELIIETGFAEMDVDYVNAHGFGEPGKYVLISVTDTGTGIDEITKQNMFEPFFTTKEVGVGTGLGLSIVYGIVKQHNGFINVYSELGMGTTFRVYLPLIQAAIFTAESSHAPVLAGGSETILIVEDEPQVRLFSKTTLEGFGYRVIEAVDGEDALARFEEHKEEIHLLLLDVLMPKRNGQDVYNEIQKLKPDIKVIFCSGHTGDVLIDKGLIKEGTSFIEKPMSPNLLAGKVREILDGSLIMTGGEL